MQNTMQIVYESVLYKSGIINKNNVPGFASIHYDHEPSPLTVLGGGTNSIFGPGGVVDGVGSVIRNVQSGNILGAILSATNTYNNAKKIKKKDVKEELKGIAKEGVLEVGANKAMEALIEVYESDVNRIELGQSVNLTSENGGFAGILKGIVHRISPQVRQRKVLSTDPTGDADARVVEVRVALDPGSAAVVSQLTGMKVIARFEPL